MKNLNSESVYFLLLELLNNGEAGLLPEIEPLTADEITAELERRTGNKFGLDLKSWARWFLGSKEFGSEMERANFLIFLEVIKFFETNTTQK